MKFPRGADNFKIKEIPDRAKFPIEVKVTAYQWSTALDPRFATATPVTQTPENEEEKC